jgi:hypothetical protein
MKAAVIYGNGGPDVLRYEDVPDPECPKGCVVIDDHPQHGIVRSSEHWAGADGWMR